MWYSLAKFAKCVSDIFFFFFFLTFETQQRDSQLQIFLEYEDMNVSSVLLLFLHKK